MEGHGSGVVDHGFDVDGDIAGREAAACVVGPLDELKAGADEDVPEACIVPLLRVVEAVAVEVKNSQPVGRFVRFDHGIRRTLDPPGDAKGTQQMAHEGGLARAQLALQLDEGIAQRRARGQVARENGSVVFVAPAARGVRFYNRQVTASNQLVTQNIIVRIEAWARELGFSQIGVAGVDLSSAEDGLMQWLAQGFHGDMNYMAAHGTRRARPAELVPGTVSVITARMDYLPRGTAVRSESAGDWQAIEFDRLARPEEGIVSLYARGRDYHKVLRSRLQKLADRMAVELGAFGHRVFTDSAPVLEAELASRSGQGWRGKHTLVLDRAAGSMFFLGEIYVDMALPHSAPVTAHCGSCSACIDVCPTQAIIAPHRLDARRCISYLTIEHAGPIPMELRPLIGNRIYGCDDCQLICPWNKFAQRSALPDFDPREGMTGQHLTALFGWSETDFLRLTEGSPIRRIGHERWLRNVAVGLGNALRVGLAGSPGNEAIRAALSEHQAHSSDLVREHVAWALAQVDTMAPGEPLPEREPKSQRQTKNLPVNNIDG